MPERLFFAIPIVEKLRERLRELQEISMVTLAEHRIASVRAENLRNAHITVRFLGDVDDAEVLITSLDGKVLSTPRFSYSVNEIDVFDSPRKARVLWAGVGDHEVFRSLRAELDTLLDPLGFEPEKKRYQPHLTLARFREAQDISSCYDELRQLTDVCSIDRFQVSEVVLYSSKLSPQGATHTKRALLKLS